MRVADCGIAVFMQKYPHNTDCGDMFRKLINVAYRIYTVDGQEGKLSIDEFIDMCLNAYGGTVAGALIGYLDNHI